jgi:hypothetical protein
MLDVTRLGREPVVPHVVAPEGVQRVEEGDGEGRGGAEAGPGW